MQLLHDQKTSFGSDRVAHYMQISPHDTWNEDNGNLLAWKHTGHIVTDLLSLSSAKRKKMVKRKEAQTY